MSNLERFGLISGIIGLVSDLIALTTFVLGYWQPATSNQTNGGMPAILIVVTGLLIFYGWVVISWVLTRRKYLIQKRRRQKKLFESSGDAVLGVGIFVAPIYLLWIIAIAQSINDPTTAQLVHAKAEATSIAQLALTPYPTVEEGKAPPTPVILQSVEDIIAQEQVGEEAFGYIFVILFGSFFYLIIGTGVKGIIDSLIPIVYPEMERPPLSKQ